MLCTVLCLLLSGAAAQAKGLTVRPSKCAWQSAMPGTCLETRNLTITNVSGCKRAYVITARSCAYAGVTLADGYEELPDMTWVQLDRRHLPVDANSQAQVKVCVNVPAGIEYAGRKWQFYIEVREDVPRYGYLQGQPDRFGLAIFLRARVSTVTAAGSAEMGGVAAPLSLRLYRETITEKGRFDESGRDHWFGVWNMICLYDTRLFDTAACAGMGDISNAGVRCDRGRIYGYANPTEEGIRD